MASLEKVDDFPLYVMKYRSEYFFDYFVELGTEWCLYQEIYEKVNPDACTSFVTLNPESEKIFGRNFDWKHKASLLLFTEPSDGYASVSMVDLYYLGLEGMQEIPWSKRFILLGAPYATIDGMNECGVAIAQNEVPKRYTPKVPDRPTLLNSMMVRLVLDYASNVDEAIALILQYNIEFANVWARIAGDIIQHPSRFAKHRATYLRIKRCIYCRIHHKIILPGRSYIISTQVGSIWLWGKIMTGFIPISSK
jgi:hypothetical protein